MTAYERIEASRIERGARDNTLPCVVPTGMGGTGRVKFVRDDYAVAKVYDDGRKPTPVKYNLTHEGAERTAGKMRDGLTDAEVQVCIDERWTYGVIALKGGRGGNVPRKGITAKRGFYPSRGRK